jgi:hypothetical protein
MIPAILSTMIVDSKKQSFHRRLMRRPVQSVKTFNRCAPFKGGALFKVQGSMPNGGSRFKGSKVQRKINQKGELPRFENSQNVEMSSRLTAARSVVAKAGGPSSWVSQRE